MKNRTIQDITYAHEFQMGPMRVKQPLPSSHLEQVSPFILLHHAGPETWKPGEYDSRLGPHPHRGFEPVTFIFDGKMHHRDSLGTEGFLYPGDVQWMTAGSGIIHSEGPSDEFKKEGGTIEIIQLWINLPREHKMTTPKYQDIPSSKIPVIVNDKHKIKVVAGTFNEIIGPASTFTNILAMRVDFETGAHMSFEIPPQYNLCVYVLNGGVMSDSSEIKSKNMVVYHADGDKIELTANGSGKMLLLAGETINEPMVSYGPFVMNYSGEIKQAILDYEQGKMGKLDY